MFAVITHRAVTVAIDGDVIGLPADFDLLPVMGVATAAHRCAQLNQIIRFIVDIECGDALIVVIGLATSVALFADVVANVAVFEVFHGPDSSSKDNGIA